MHLLCGMVPKFWRSRGGGAVAVTDDTVFSAANASNTTDNMTTLCHQLTDDAPYGEEWHFHPIAIRGGALDTTPSADHAIAENVDRVGEAVADLRQMSVEMSIELTAQNARLDRLREKTSTNIGRVNAANAHTNRLNVGKTGDRKKAG